MSRWLWALLGGVVLVAIAAVFWTASNRTNVSPPVSPEPTAVAPAPVPPAPPAPAPVVHERASSPAAPAVQQAATPPAPAPPPAPGAPPAPPVVQAAPAPLPAAPNPAPNPGQQAASPPALAPRPSASSAPPVVAKEAPSAAAPLAEPPLPPPAPGRETQEVAGVFAPKNLAQLVGAWAYSEGDCDRLFQRRGGGWAFRQPVDKFAQAAIVEFLEKNPSAFRHLPD